MNKSNTKTNKQRIEIADEIIDRADTVSILSRDEVQDIYTRALSGEFDDIFDGENRG